VHRFRIVEGASSLLAIKYDEKLDIYLDSIIMLIAAAQKNDGYLTICITNKCARLSGWWGTRRWEKIIYKFLININLIIF
jgi:DUF1680 family protein